MGLEEIFSPIGAALGPEACRFVGPDRVDDTGKPPRIAWNPVGSRLLPAKRIRGDEAGDPIYTRQWSIAVEAWGEDLGAAEALVDRFLAAAHDLLTKHSFQPTEEDWNPGGVTAKGCRCVLTLFIARPVLRTPPVTATATSIVATTSVEGSVEELTATIIE